MRKTLLLGLTALIVIVVASGFIFNELFLTQAQTSLNGQICLGSDDPFDAFLKIDTIEGESQDADHRGWIEIESFSHGLVQIGIAVGAGGAGKAGRVSMEDFKLVMNYSKASPKLFLAVCTGQHFKSAVLQIRRLPDKKPFLNWTFSDVSITSYRTSGESFTDPKPTDEITMNFGKIEISYQQYDSEGNKVGSPVKAGWDLKQNKKT